MTVDHLFGSTTIKTRPQRVVTLGGGDMEASIALGVVPVAGADWFGNPNLRGWVKSALGDRPAPKLIAASEPKYEEIAALKPDLIVYVNTINDKLEYETLNAIAPTIAAPAGTENVYGVPWQDQVREIAKATGTTTAGEQVVRDTEKLVTDAAKANPEFAGKVITAGVYSANSLNAWLPSDPRIRLLTSLGFKTNPQIDAMENGDFSVKISPELTPKLNADVIFMAALDSSGKLDPAVVNDPPPTDPDAQEGADRQGLGQLHPSGHDRCLSAESWTTAGFWRLSSRLDKGARAVRHDSAASRTGG
ncbi:ABC transporter substrate-binding protein [Kribbella sp. GL6]|uniref:ABC transporter substrate-binding protein n=1 Tax=Kribbella sp. GL6 TaxID=3419765 RepID=UPI003D089C90